MKTYKRISIVASLAALLLAGQAPTASAASNVPYDTYTYSYDGRPLQSPHAYVPEKRMSGGSLGTTALAQPEDLFIDSGGRVYIADTGNNRILVLDEKDVLIAVIEEFGGDRFNRPTGVFVTQDGQLYVADRGNKRILEFNTDYTLKRTIPAPEIAMLPDGFNYDPTAITVDKTGRIYVLSTGSVYGVITLTSDGEFDSFLGSQRVSPNLVERFWRIFMSDEQKRRTMRYVPTNYNNMAMDADGFLYLTAVHSDTAAVAASIAGRSTSDEYASVKKLNYYGDDVLERQGFYPPAGDVKIVMTGTDSDEVYGPSNIIDVSLDANGSYSLADDKRNKIFTYDEHGNLLYVFGGTGYQLGQFQKLKAVAYKDGDIYALDSAGNITAFTRTEYGSLINEAIRLARDRKYEESVAVWEEVLLQNGNFDMAILGIGDAYYRAGDYESAMECYPGELTAEDVELFRICSDVEGVSRFATSSDYVNSLHVIMTNTLLNNFQGKPTDTPVWEKNGWTGDVNVTLGSMSFNYDVGGLLQYYEDMMRDCQLENGLVPLIAPAADWGREDHVVWSSLYILLVEHLERVYGKERYAASQYESMRRLAKLYIAKAEQGGWILPGGELSDWVAPAGGTKPGVPGHASSSEGSAACAAYFACAALRAMQTLAQRLGLAADAAEYESARKKLEEAFNAHFLDKERGLYETGDWAAMGSRTRYRQTTNLAALAMGIVPPEYRERVVENLVADIEEKGEHLDTGMVGTRLILPTLSEAGHPQLAYRLLTQTTYPSWGYWLASGATSCWEGYEETCRSRDHYFLGTYEQWLFEYLAGIRDVRGGFRSLTLAPLWPDGLDWVRAELDTVRGRLASAWSREEGGIVYEAAIPTGTAAVIRLPLPEGAGLQINGAQPGAPIPGVIDLRREDGKLTVQAGSGVYRFQIYPQADK